MQRNDNPPGREKAVDTEWFHSYKNAPARLPAAYAGNGAKPSGRADCISCKDTNKPGAKTNLFAFYRRGVSKTKLKIITRRAENQIQLLFSAPPRNEARRGAFSFRSSVLAGASKTGMLPAGPTFGRFQPGCPSDLRFEESPENSAPYSGAKHHSLYLLCFYRKTIKIICFAEVLYYLCLTGG